MSIQQIAQIAGVPYSTTWRAINHFPGVSPVAAKAVKEAMEQIGYVHPPDRRRKATEGATRRRHRNVAMLYLRESNDLSISILRAVQKILIEQSISLIFGHVLAPEDLPPAVLSGDVDGILGYGEFPQAAITPSVLEIPAVWMMSRVQDHPDQWGDRIMSDHRAIGELAARYLLDRSHRHVAFLNPAPVYPFICERGMGFAAMASDRADSVEIVAADRSLPPNSPQAIEQVVDAWANLNPRPTGLFVPTDIGSVAVYRLLNERKVKPGRDVELISCDKREEFLSQLNPRPASIDLNREMIARVAVDRLLWRMREGSNAGPPVRIVVGPFLEGYSS